MTENICHSILKTVTQQIIQSAGFEAANNHSIETLTNVFEKYIELLGSTVSAYANLNGRTMGTTRDLAVALEEICIDPVSLRNWLEEDGKALTPCWSAQSDPGRLLQGVINGGRPNVDDVVEYTFGDIEEFDIPSSPTSPIEESPTPPALTDSLPKYIPSYFPPFPEVKEDVIMDETDKLLLEKQKQLEEQIQLKSSESLPLPVIVKKRKKPIDNPFIHIMPFEDSTLASENEEQSQQPKPLSLSLTISNKRNIKLEEEAALRRQKAAVAPLTEALQNIKPPTYIVGEGLADQDKLFIEQAQDMAAPGGHLFNHDAGVFDDLVRNITDPLALSKLTTPNLLIDVAAISNGSTTMNNSPSATPTSLVNHNIFDYTLSGSLPTSPDGTGKISRSNSMLAVLAGGATSKKVGLKNLNKLSKVVGNPAQSSPMSLNAFTKDSISKSSVDINSIRHTESKYMLKKKRMLTEQQNALKRQKLLEQSNGNPNIEGSKPPAPTTITPTAVTTNTTTPVTTTTSALSAGLPPTGLPPTGLPPTGSSSTGLSSIGLSSTGLPPSGLTASAPSITPQATQVKTMNRGPMSLQSFSTSSMGSNSAAAIQEKKVKVKKNPNLMLNLSQNPASTFSSTDESPNTPKIRFKLKGPEQSEKSPKTPKNSKPTTPTSPYDNIPVKVERSNSSNYQLHLYQQPASSANEDYVNLNGYTTSEETRCICENPTINYGTFMIACDNCSVWFHGSCVGIAESDQVEEWYCRRCKRKFLNK